MAIVAVDVVGYSRLMALDEEGTLATWQELRSLIDPIFQEEGGGRIVKSTGDGLLIEASSVIEAVRASLRVQELLEEWNRDRQPDQQIRLRIGVNLGDVILDDTGDIHGDGVNVAARLEGLAEPGTICLSDAAYQQVKGRVDVPIVDGGQQRVKNIPTPIRVWSMAPAGTAGVGRRRRRPSPVAIGGAVLAVVAVVVAFSLFSGNGGGESTTTTTPTATTAVIPSAADWEVGLGAEIEELVVAETSVIVALADGTVAAVDDEGALVWPEPYSVGGPVSGLVAAPGIAVVGADGSRVIRAIGVTSGTEAWRSLVSLQGVDETPRLAGASGSVFVGLGFGLSRLTDDTGAEVWTRDLVGSQVVDTVSASDVLVAVGDGRFVHGVDPDDGTVLWQVGPPRLAGGAAWLQAWTIVTDVGNTEVVESRVAVVSGDLELLVLDGRSGAVLWSVPVSGVPAIAEDTLFVAGVDGEVVALAADGGAVVWTRDDLRPRWPLVSADGSLVVLEGSSALLLNPRSGTTTETVDLGAEPTGPPVVHGDLVILPFGSTLTAVRLSG